jgi:putative endonuclease
MLWQRQPVSNKNKGACYEEAAKRLTEKAGFKTIGQNYFCRGGELDIICRRKNTLCFIEVKYRKSNSHGHALEQVTRGKQQRILLAAKTYLNENKQYQNHVIRFDVIAVTSLQNELQFDWIENAFY